MSYSSDRVYFKRFTLVIGFQRNFVGLPNSFAAVFVVFFCKTLLGNSIDSNVSKASRAATNRSYSFRPCTTLLSLFFTFICFSFFVSLTCFRIAYLADCFARLLPSDLNIDHVTTDNRSNVFRQSTATARLGDILDTASRCQRTFHSSIYPLNTHAHT